LEDKAVSLVLSLKLMGKIMQSKKWTIKLVISFAVPGLIK
jgi:hypothetical protein